MVQERQWLDEATTGQWCFTLNAALIEEMAIFRYLYAAGPLFPLANLKHTIKKPLIAIFSDTIAAMGT
jgi:hypothetical protein